MKSLVVEKPGILSLLDCALPEPAPGEVRVRVERAGICGSDVHIFHGSNPFAKYPRVIGHEFFGRIDALGEGTVADLGKRVVIDPVIACGHLLSLLDRPARTSARACRCSVSIATAASRSSAASRSGMPTWFPDEVTDEQAALVEPFSIAANITDHNRRLRLATSPWSTGPGRSA